MRVDIRIDPEFIGPTLSELEPVLFDIEGVVEVPWTNNKKDILVLDRLQSTDIVITLVVRDYDTHMRTATALGMYTRVDDTIIQSVTEGLSKLSSTTWRPTVDALGPNKTMTVLSNVVGNAIRCGKTPNALVSTLSMCLHQGISPLDVDVFLRLKRLRGSR